MRCAASAASTLYTAAIVHAHASQLTRARRPRLLIVGCGDVGLRAARRLVPRWRVIALTSSPDRVDALRRHGVTPLVGNLDDAATLRRLGPLAAHVLHLAPPPADGERDSRTRALLAVLARGGCTRSLVYVSTTGVYGDAGGAWVDETRAVAPATARAQRRVDAERHVRVFGRVHGTRITILRVPGIYARDREGGDPVARVRSGAPVLVPAHDVITNRIHADDLARACIAALVRGRPQRVLNVCDDLQLPMGDAMDRVADLAGLPRPPRITREEAKAVLSPMALSFWSESRRVSNARMKRELRLCLLHPTFEADVRAAHARAVAAPAPPPCVNASG